jgi:hypothetical protein
MLVIFACAVAYLYLSRHERGPDSVIQASQDAPPTAAAEPAAG